MITNTSVLMQIAICLLGLLGYLVARHIHIKKARKQTVVCPLKMDCHAVVHSDYSSFFGIHLEIFGMIYYALLTLSYVVLILWPGALSVGFIGVIVVLSILAFLFSLYLIWVQLFVLKQGCFWCYISALDSTIIFILTVLVYDVSSMISGIF